MGFIIFAIAMGVILAIVNNIGDIFTITDFEAVHGPITTVDKEHVEDLLLVNNRLRSSVISVTYMGKDGTQKHSYIRAPVDLFTLNKSSQESLLLKALRRDNRKPLSVIKHSSLA